MSNQYNQNDQNNQERSQAPIYCPNTYQNAPIPNLPPQPHPQMMNNNQFLNTPIPSNPKNPAQTIYSNLQPVFVSHPPVINKLGQQYMPVPQGENELPTFRQVYMDDGDNKICGTKVPILDYTTTILLFIVNIFLPGMGTMLVGISSGHDCFFWFCLGFTQLLLATCIVGWVWGLITGLQIIRIAKKYDYM